MKTLKYQNKLSLDSINEDNESSDKISRSSDELSSRNIQDIQILQPKESLLSKGNKTKPKEYFQNIEWRMEIEPPKRIIFQNKRGSCRTMVNNQNLSLVGKSSSLFIQSNQNLNANSSQKEQSENSKLDLPEFFQQNVLKSSTQDVRNANVFTKIYGDNNLICIDVKIWYFKQTIKIKGLFK